MRGYLKDLVAPCEFSLLEEFTLRLKFGVGQ